MKHFFRHQGPAITALASLALSLVACSAAEVDDVGASDSSALDDASDVEDDAAHSDDWPRSSGRAEPATTERAEEAPTPREERPETAPGDDEARPPAEPAQSEEREPPLSEDPAAEQDAEPAPVEQPEPAPSAPRSQTLRVSGSALLDTCGQPFVVRGVEQILGNQLPQGNDWLGLVREIASTGVNAVRILPGVNTLSLGDVDELLTFIGDEGLVAFLAPLGQGNSWYARDDVRAMLKKHEGFIIIDAYGEPQYDDIERWRRESKAALAEFRALGYDVPLTVTANQFGRALPSLFEHGAEILEADPQHNAFLGWQAYWGNNGYYQNHYGYSLEEAVDAIVASGLPIQLGLDHITDMPSTQADFETLMRGAQKNGIGWLWWDFYNPYGTENNLSQDGTADHLTPTGRIVLETHAASIANTAQRACAR